MAPEALHHPVPPETLITTTHFPGGNGRLRNYRKTLAMAQSPFMPRNAARLAVAGALLVGTASIVLPGCALSPSPVQPSTAAAPPHAADSGWTRQLQVFANRQGSPTKVVAAPKPPLSPFADAPVSFLIRGQFTRGELVIVRVCVAADHSIASAQVIESSGDSHFDELATQWAQRVRLRSLPTDGSAMARCGAVRVELRDAPEPRVIHGAENLLG